MVQGRRAEMNQRMNHFCDCESPVSIQTAPGGRHASLLRHTDFARISGNLSRSRVLVGTATPSSPPAPPLRRPLPRPLPHLSTSGHKRPACSAVRLARRGGGKRREVASRPGHAAVWARVRPYAPQALPRIQGCTVAAALVRATPGSKSATKWLVPHELAVQCGYRQPSPAPPISSMP